MILVTGATGLVGGHLLWYLLQSNEKVAALKRVKSNLKPLRNIFRCYTSNPDKYLERIEWRVADVSEKNSLVPAFESVTVVYHCAALVSLGSNPGSIEQINVTGTKNVLETAMLSGVSRFCFVSSIAACGSGSSESPADENSVWHDGVGRSPYSRSKYFSEQEVWKAIDKGLNAVIVNPGVILGYSGTDSGSSQLFSVVRKGLPFYIDGGSGYVCVGDVAKAMILLTESEVAAQRYILVEGNYTNRQILGYIARGFGKRVPWIKIGEGLIKFAGGILEDAGKLFGFKPPMDRNLARSAINHSFFSSVKISNEFGFRFTPMQKCIDAACKFMLRF